VPALRGPAHRHQPPARLARGLGRLVAQRHPPVPAPRSHRRRNHPAAGRQRNHRRPDARILPSPGKSPAAQEPGTATRNALEARSSRGAETTRKPGSQGRAAQQCAALTRPVSVQQSAERIMLTIDRLTPNFSVRQRASIHPLHRALHGRRG